MIDRRLLVIREAAFVSSIACIPMLSVLVSNPLIEGFSTAAVASLLFIGAMFAFNVFAVAVILASKSNAVKLTAGAPLAFELALGVPGFLSFAADQVRQGLITSGVLPGHRLATEGVFVAALVVLAVWMIRSRRRMLLSLARGISSLLALLFGTLCFQTAFAALHTSNRPLQAAATPHSDRRVVWLLMDELDQDVLETALPNLPAFNEMWQHSIVATNAFSPANFTHQSVPRMLVGRELLSAEMTQTRVSLRDRADVASHTLSSDSDFILPKLARAGKSVAVAGWDLPYCAILPSTITCVDDARTEVPGAGVSPSHWLWSQSPYVAWWTQRKLKSDSRPLQEVLLSIFRQPRLLKVNANSTTFAVVSTSTLAQIDARFDVVFAHWPCPHLPRMDGIEDTGESALMNAYRANLKACDAQLAAVAKHIQDAQTMDPRPVTLIVTSDHWLRPRDCIEQNRVHCLATHRRRVPLLIRSFDPGRDSEGNRPYTRTINNLELPQLLLYLTSGGKADQQDVVGVLDRFKDHPTIIEPF